MRSEICGKKSKISSIHILKRAFPVPTTPMALVRWGKSAPTIPFHNPAFIEQGLNGDVLLFAPDILEGLKDLISQSVSKPNNYQI